MRRPPSRAGVAAAAMLAIVVSGTMAVAAAPPDAATGFVLTPQMFGARCDADGTPGRGADDTKAIQAALDAAQDGGRTVKITGQPMQDGMPRMCRVTAPLVIHAHLTLDGDYCQPYRDTRALANTPGAGSWLYFDHAGVGLSVPADRKGAGATGTATGVTSSVATTGVVLQNVCTYRNQPPYVRAGAWHPDPNGYDIEALQDDTIIRHLVTLNPTRAVRVEGRYTIDDLRGSPYEIGIDSPLSLDVPHIANVQFWPYGTINGPAEAYKRAHLEALVLGRVDNPEITNFFAISARICIHLVPTPNGVPNKIHAVTIECDNVGNTGLLSEAPGATGQFVSVTTQGADPDAPGGRTSSYSGININAPDTRLSFDGIRVTKYGGVGIIVQKPGTWLTLNSLSVELWALNGTAATAAVEARSGAAVHVGTGAFFQGSVSRTPYAVAEGGAIDVVATRPVP